MPILRTTDDFINRAKKDLGEIDTILKKGYARFAFFFHLVDEKKTTKLRNKLENAIINAEENRGLMDEEKRNHAALIADKNAIKGNKATARERNNIAEITNCEQRLNVKDEEIKNSENKIANLELEIFQSINNFYSQMNEKIISENYLTIGGIRDIIITTTIAIKKYEDEKIKRQTQDQAVTARHLVNVKAKNRSLKAELNDQKQRITRLEHRMEEIISPRPQ